MKFDNYEVNFEELQKNVATFKKQGMKTYSFVYALNNFELLNPEDIQPSTPSTPFFVT